MELSELLGSATGWLKGGGPKDNIALSTRVRIARNLKGRIYVDRAADVQRQETLKYAMGGIEKSGALGKDALFLALKDVDELDRQFLVERHLMSREHLEDVEHKGLVIGEKELCSVMVNEEDHIRLQILMPGFDIKKAGQMVDVAENKIGRHLEFDYSPRFGYLTSCPTNTGTGLRSSCMLHLSGLVMTGQIENVFDGISKLGMTIRGFYGEGTEAVGDFFQISNQVALGHSEMDILDNLERIINKIIEREEDTRKSILSGRRGEIVDRVERSVETLKTAKIITSSETIKRLSDIRLGIDMGIVKGMSLGEVNEMLLLAQPAHLQKTSGNKAQPYERDIKRADFIRQKLRDFKNTRSSGGQDAGI
jgi:protein arginine kinase